MTQIQRCQIQIFYLFFYFSLFSASCPRQTLGNFIWNVTCKRRYPSTFSVRRTGTDFNFIRTCLRHEQLDRKPTQYRWNATGLWHFRCRRSELPMVSLDHHFMWSTIHTDGTSDLGHAEFSEKSREWKIGWKLQGEFGENIEKFGGNFGCNESDEGSL